MCIMIVCWGFTNWLIGLHVCKSLTVFRVRPFEILKSDWSASPRSFLCRMRRNTIEEPLPCAVPCSIPPWNCWCFYLPLPPSSGSPAVSWWVLGGERGSGQDGGRLRRGRLHARRPGHSVHQGSTLHRQRVWGVGQTALKPLLFHKVRSPSSSLSLHPQSPFPSFPLLLPWDL